MTTRIVVDPVTRIEGHLRIEATLNDSNHVGDAMSSGTMWRGLEVILQGRDPRDAWAFCERICGVCTTVHALASVRSVENALDIKVPTNAQIIRNIMFLTQMVQDHVVHFYHLHALDWVDVVSALKADPAQTSALAQKISPNSPITGVGYCFGGCFADTDCPTGTKCQVEEGLCVAKVTTFTKLPGAACTYKTSGTQDCNCFAASATDKGYCSQFCEVGDTTHSCPTGLKCAAVLPTTCASGSALFPKSPTGMAGNCLIPCTADTDCKDSTGADISSTCQNTPDGKFCLPFTSDPSSGC